MNSVVMKNSRSFSWIPNLSPSLVWESYCSCHMSHFTW